MNPHLDATGRTHRPLGPLRPDAPYDVVFLDRDGTLNALAPGYRTPGDFTILPGAAHAAASLSRAGARLVIVTNQRGLARGHLTWQQLDAVNTELVRAIVDAGGVVDDVRLCPHDVGECDCRKPSPGLILQLLADNPQVRPERCVMVGDAASDADAAASAGIVFLRVPPEVGLPAALDSLRSHAPGTIPFRS